MTSIYGWLASSSTLIYRIPQIYRLYKRKQSADISFYSLLFQVVGCIFYIIHGFIINDYPIIAMGSGTLFQTLILMIFYLIYSKKKDIVTTPNSVSKTNVGTELPTD